MVPGAVVGGMVCTVCADEVVSCGRSVTSLVGGASVVEIRSVPTDTGMEQGPCPALVDAHTSIWYRTLSKSNPLKMTVCPFCTVWLPASWPVEATRILARY